MRRPRNGGHDDASRRAAVAVFPTRIALLVDDLDKAFEVYRDLLGFTSSSSATTNRIPSPTRSSRSPGGEDPFRRTLIGEPAAHPGAHRGTGPRGGPERTPGSGGCPGGLGCGDPRCSDKLGLKTCKPRTELDPAKGPPRTESGFYDHDGHTVVIYNLE